MPRKSERQLILEDVTCAMEQAMNDEMDEEEDGGCLLDDRASETELDRLAELLVVSESSGRLYLHPAPRSGFLRDNFMDLPDSIFRQITRMSRACFDWVLTQVQSHPVFQSSRLRTPIWMQLAVTLDRLATYGTGATLGRTGLLWGISPVACDQITTRAVTAIGDCAATYVRWPSAHERRRISSRMSEQGFDGCVGFIDGTTFPLFQKPATDGECYKDRKQRYSLNAQVVCDDLQRIIAFTTGWPGSCTDSTVYESMDIAASNHKRLYFDEGQHLLADSAYPKEMEMNTILPSYKIGDKGAYKALFNNCVAHVRIVNEQTVGMLKNRWTSLRELRVPIKDVRSLEKILAWIKACVVLHNMLHTLGDRWEDTDPQEGDYRCVGEASAEDTDEDEQFSEVDSSDEEVDEDKDPYLLRRAVKKRAIAIARQPGGILWKRGW